MSDRSSAPESDRPLDDAISEPALEADAPSPRRSARRRLVTPVTAALCGLLLATAGFIAGVQVQKGQADDPTATAGAAGAAGRFAGGPNAAAGGGGGGGDAPTVGSVANKQGSTLYVEDADGTTVRVKTNAQSKVTRTAAASVRGVYPGDTVIVQGTKDKSGDLVATQITATSKTAAAAGGGGLRQAFGGGAPPGGGAPSAGRVPQDEVTGGG